MTERLSEQASSIGALAEPVRRALYDFVVAQREPVSREQAADGIDVPVHTAKFHLDKLVEEGLLEVEFRRLTGRTGPGAGRPSKLYHRSSRQMSVSLPERRYDVVGRILAAGVERAGAEDVPVQEALAQVATEEGRRVAAGVTTTGADIERVDAVLRDQGYEPARRDQDLLLANCPFDALAREHTELVCGINESFVHGVVDGLGCTGLAARLDPEDGLCCVKVRAESPAPEGGPRRTG